MSKFAHKHLLSRRIKVRLDQASATLDDLLEGSLGVGPFLRPKRPNSSEGRAVERPACSGAKSLRVRSVSPEAFRIAQCSPATPLLALDEPGRSRDVARPWLGISRDCSG